MRENIGRQLVYVSLQKPAIKNDLLNLKQKLKEPKYLRHIAVVPEREQAFLFMIPKKGYVAEAFPVIYKWLNNMLEQKRIKKAEARGN